MAIANPLFHKIKVRKACGRYGFTSYLLAVTAGHLSLLLRIALCTNLGLGEHPVHVYTTILLVLLTVQTTTGPVRFAAIAYR